MPKFWTWQDDEEVIPFSTPEEAIEDCVNETGEMPTKVYGYDPMPLWVPDSDRYLEILIEDLVEENGDNGNLPNDLTRAAAKEFVDLVVQEFGDSYWCECVEVRDVS